MPSAELNVDEVDNKAESKSIGDVSGDAGEQKSERAKDSIIGPRRSPEEIDYECSRDERDYGQSPSPGIAMIVEHAECDARVMSVRKIQESRDHGNVISESQTIYGPCLCRLIDQKNPAGDGEVSELPNDVAFIHCAFFDSAGFAFGSAKKDLFIIFHSPLILRSVM